MKRKLLIFVCALLLLFAMTAFVACGKTEEPPTGGPGTEQGGGEGSGSGDSGSGEEGSGGGSGSGEEGSGGGSGSGEGSGSGGSGSLAQITGVTFAGKTVTYTGEEYEIVVSGTIPTGVSVSYTNNKATNSGTYNASAVLSGDGYETKTLTTTLKINKATFDVSGLSWSTSSFTYDGSEKSVTINGTLPNGLTIQSYSGNKATNVGNYTASVTFSYDTQNYNAPTFASKNWSIAKATMTGLIFASETFDYDATEKTIEVQGAIPSGSTVTYVCQENSGMTNTAKETGTYTITVTITNPNFYDYTSTATMTIRGEEKERFIVMHDGVVYFANALHEDFLYSYDASKAKNSQLSMVSYDVPYNFVVKGTDIYFRGKAIFGGSIKKITTGTDVSVSAVADQKGEYLVTDGTNFYFVVNALTQNKSGIYKIVLSEDTDPVVTLLSVGKAKYLQYDNGYLYFADGSNGYKLSKISVNGGTRTLLRDEKITALTADNGFLYYTVNNLLGDYIANYNLSNNTYKKLTIDAGANLTVIGDKLYYINTDLLTSYVQGDGIYSVTAKPLIDMNLPGTKVVGEDTYSSLTKIDDNTIAYYRISDQMLCLRNLSNGSATEVLDGFVAPETVPLSTGSKTDEYNGILYYLDLHRDKCLYSYNPETKERRKLTSNKVADFSIIGDYLYYNSVSWIVNNDLYRINLKAGGEPEKISTYDCKDVVFDGNKIFYVEQNAAAVRTALHEIAADGTDTIIYDKGVNNLRYYDGYLYFIDGDDLYRMPTTGYTVNTPTRIRKGDVDVFEIDNGVIYFREVLLINKQLSKINVDGTGYAVVLTGYDPVDIVIDNGYIYFYSDTTKASTAGIFKVAIGQTAVTQVMAKTISSTTYYPSDMIIIDGNIYFVNYALGGLGGDSHVYKVSTSGGTPEKEI